MIEVGLTCATASFLSTPLSRIMSTAAPSRMREVDVTLQHIGGVWQQRSRRFVASTPPDLQGLKGVYLSEIAATGLLAAFFLLLSQAALLHDLGWATPLLR